MEEKQAIVTMSLTEYEKIKEELNDYKLKYQELVDRHIEMRIRFNDTLLEYRRLIDKVNSLEKRKKWRL